MLRGKSLREIFLREKFKHPKKVVINTNIKIPISHEDEDPDDLNEDQLRTLIRRMQSREEYRLAEQKGIVPQDIVPQKRSRKRAVTPEYENDQHDENDDIDEPDDYDDDEDDMNDKRVRKRVLSERDAYGDLSRLPGEI